MSPHLDTGIQHHFAYGVHVAQSLILLVVLFGLLFCPFVFFFSFCHCTVCPCSITYQRQTIRSNISTQILLGNDHDFLVHAQCIHQQYNLEQEILTLPNHLISWLWCLTMLCSLFIFCVVHHCPLFVFFTLVFSVGHNIVCPSAVCAFWLPFFGDYQTVQILLYTMTSSFWFTQTWHIYVKRQYDIKQYICNGIRI